jgi:hypothetical protein
MSSWRAWQSPGDGSFDHRAVMAVARLPGRVFRALSMLPLERVVVVEAAAAETAMVAPEQERRQWLLSSPLAPIVSITSDCLRTSTTPGGSGPAKAFSRPPSDTETHSSRRILPALTPHSLTREAGARLSGADSAAGSCWRGDRFQYPTSGALCGQGGTEHAADPTAPSGWIPHISLGRPRRQERGPKAPLLSCVLVDDEIATNDVVRNALERDRVIACAR